MFGDLSFELDFGLSSGGLDLNLAGEGLDFVPLPTVDASILQDLASFTTLPNYHYPSTLLTSNDSTTTMLVTNDSDGGGAIDTANSSNTSVNANNRHLIKHYLDVMKGYAKVDDRARDANNLFISAFTKSLYFPPLFHAILAFSASHLAMEDPSYADQAHEFSRLAGESFDTFRRAENFEADGLLSALFVRVKTVHMLAGSVDSFLELIAAAVDIISTKKPQVEASDPASSPWTGRTMLRLAILDARASYHRLGGGQLVNFLREIPACSSLFAQDLPQTESEGALFNLLRADIFRMRVADLDVRLHEQLNGEFVTAAPIRIDEVKALYANIRYEIEQWNKEMAKKMDIPDFEEPLIEDQVLGSTAYGYYIVLSALHSALLYLYNIFARVPSSCFPDILANIVKPLPSFNPEQSISKVMYCQLKIAHDPSRATSPSSILPSSIFIAGLMTSDAVHRHWIIQLLKAGEKWGTYVKKARELLEAMLRQSAGSDVRDTMDEITGRFII